MPTIHVQIKRFLSSIDYGLVIIKTGKAQKNNITVLLCVENDTRERAGAKVKQNNQKGKFK